MNIQNYKYKYDLHVHTSPVSKCGDIDPRGCVDRYMELGFSGFAITNHFGQTVLRDFTSKEDFMDFYLKDFFIAKKYGEELGFDVIFGLEIRFPESTNEYLVYGIDEDDAYRAYDYIFGNYEAFYKGFKNDKNVILQAHPYRHPCFLQNTDILDGIEVFNMHPHHNSCVSLAARTAQENPRLIISGGTDFHHEGHQGLCALCSGERINNSFSLSKLLKSRDYIFDVCGNKILPYNFH